MAEEIGSKCELGGAQCAVVGGGFGGTGLRGRRREFYVVD